MPWSQLWRVTSTPQLTVCAKGSLKLWVPLLSLWSADQAQGTSVMTLKTPRPLFNCSKNIAYHSPGWCSSVDWARSYEPKSYWFNSQSGHMPGLWARSPVGGMWEVGNNTLMFLSLSFSPSLPISLKINKIFKKLLIIIGSEDIELGEW